jgi:mannitol/fructose-specific phosphotransferase system IIA component (Ntr-type)
MNLRDKLKENTIILPIKATTQTDAIQELLTHLQGINILTATSKLISYIDINEKKSPSAAGRGIAYPHSTSIEVENLVCVLGFSKDGIDYNSPDGQLCHIILLTLSPDEYPREHRKFITRFRTMIDNPVIRSQLLDANQPIEVINIIQQWEEEDALTDNFN